MAQRLRRIWFDHNGRPRFGLTRLLRRAYPSDQRSVSSRGAVLISMRGIARGTQPTLIET
jgi:hypothetical protein